MYDEEMSFIVKSEKVFKQYFRNRTGLVISLFMKHSKKKTFSNILSSAALVKKLNWLVAWNKVNVLVI